MLNLGVAVKRIVNFGEKSLLEPEVVNKCYGKLI